MEVLGIWVRINRLHWTEFNVWVAWCWYQQLLHYVVFFLKTAAFPHQLQHESRHSHMLTAHLRWHFHTEHRLMTVHCLSLGYIVPLHCAICRKSSVVNGSVKDTWSEQRNGCRGENTGGVFLMVNMQYVYVYMHQYEHLNPNLSL